MCAFWAMKKWFAFKNVDESAEKANFSFTSYEKKYLFLYLRHKNVIFFYPTS